MLWPAAGAPPRGDAEADGSARCIGERIGRFGHARGNGRRVRDGQIDVRRRRHVAPRRLVRQDRHRLALDDEVAAVHEVENAADILFLDGRGHARRPADIAKLGIERGEPGQCRAVRGDEDTAECRQFAQPEQRLGAVIECIGARPKGDAPIAFRRDFIGVAGVEQRVEAIVDQVQQVVEAVAFLSRAFARPFFGGHGRSGGCGDRRRGRHAGALEPAEHGGVGRRRVGVAGGGDMIGEHVERSHDRRDEIGRERQRAVADEIEQRLIGMGIGLERFVPERAGAALDRMHRAKHGIDHLGVGIVAAKRIQAALDGR